MAQPKMTPSAPAGVVEQNIALTGRIMKFMLDNPDVFKALPDGFELIILPEDNPAIRQYNLELLDRYGNEGKPIVFARIKTQSENIESQDRPSFFVPLPLAA
jgi:hypothetical protein